MDLYVREAGSRDAPTIVFLHGGPLSGAMWLPQFERLADYHCLAPDLPEQGKSADIGPFTLEDAARRVAELIRKRARGGRAHVVCLSAGAAVAVRLLHDAHEVVDHMLVSGAPTRMSPFLAKLNDLNEPVIRWLGPERLTNLVMRQFHIPAEYRLLILEGIRESRPEFILHYDYELTRIVLPGEAHAPLLITVGQKETLPAKRAARELCRVIAGAQGRMVPHVGHVWSLEAPDLFVETVRAWITDSPLPSGLVAL
jgi:pimeloyl-ACP methyl ester carboxylesterase